MKERPPRGPIGAFFIVAALFAAGAVALDFITPRASDAFIAQPGAPALIGAGAALGAALMAHALRFALGRREGKDDAGDRA